MFDSDAIHAPTCRYSESPSRHSQRANHATASGTTSMKTLRQAGGASGPTPSAAAIGLRKGDAGITTPFMQAAAEEGYDFRCGRWALERDDERDDERRHERGMDGRG